MQLKCFLKNLQHTIYMLGPFSLTVTTYVEFQSGLITFPCSDIAVVINYHPRLSNSCLNQNNLYY